MKHPIGILPAAALLLLPAAGVASAAEPSDSFAKAFASPPPEARPGWYSFFVNGLMTKRGMTADLEAAAAIGLGQLRIFDVREPQVERIKGVVPVTPYDSPEWWAAYQHLFKEGERLGIDIEPMASLGYSQNGGFWVQPEDAMKQLVIRELRVSAPADKPLRLPEPIRRQGIYHDVAVLAFPAPAPADSARIASQLVEVATVADGKPLPWDLSKHQGGACVGAPVIADKPKSVELACVFSEPVAPRSVRVKADALSGAYRFVVESSADGKDYAACGSLRVAAEMGFYPYGPGEWVRIPISGNPARFYRIRMVSFDGKPHTYPSWLLHPLAACGGIAFSGEAAATDYLGQGGACHFYPMELAPEGAAKPDGCVPLDAVQDLTASLRPDGTLDWTPPSGDWIVLRCGYTIDDHKHSHPTYPTKGSYEADKMDPGATERYFQNLVGRWASEAGQRTGKSFSGIHLDSWECGTQNWTPDMPAQFQALHGYDLPKWLPALAGYAVADPASTRRFFRDFRFVIGHLTCEQFRLFRRLANQAGLKFSLQPYGNVYGDQWNTIEAAGIPDYPDNENWGLNPGYSRVSGIDAAGRAWGHRVITAEAFNLISWKYHLPTEKEQRSFIPGDNKAGADQMFCLGVNRLLWNENNMQPFAPDWFMGLQSGEPNFINRGYPWFKDLKPYMNYLARAQAVLQQGVPVTDIAYCPGEGSPLRVDFRYLKPSDQFTWTPVAPSLVRTGMKVKDGRLTLPGGQEFRLLLLPPEDTATPEFLRAVHRLVEEGAWVAGIKPKAAPGLAGQPKADAEVRRLADALWGKSPMPPDGRPVGKGRVFDAWNMEELRAADRPLPGANAFNYTFFLDPKIDAALAAAGLEPDLRVSDAAGKKLARRFERSEKHRDTAWNAIHLRDGGSDVYFFSNQGGQPMTFHLSLRINGKVPELWDAETGRQEDAPVWRLRDGRTELVLPLDRQGSVFIVFRRPIDHGADWVAECTAHGTDGRLETGPDGRPRFAATRSGSFEAQTAKGRTLKATADVPEPIAVAGPWKVKFQEQRGAPSAVDMPNLLPLNEHPDFGVRHFAGLAEYSSDFTVPEAWLRPDRRVSLDLGKVFLTATVFVNGAEAAMLYKEPYRADITPHLRPGTNQLRIRVATPFVNRMIGDAYEPEDLATESELPDWLENPAKRPTKRVGVWLANDNNRKGVFTRDTLLVPSGLPGPVVLRGEQFLEMK